jgi:Uma2 family endonuclease
VLVVEKTERHNRFSIPLLTVEIVSYSSRNNDLYFMPHFYETIGVREFFIGETEEETGRIIRGYRLKNGQYQPIAAKKDGYESEVVGQLLPKTWPL